VGLREAAQGLSTLCPSPLRGEIRTSVAGCHLLVDCYNANPKAVEAALEALDHLAGEARKVAVLGEMRELGEHSREAHARVGRAAAAQKIDVLYLLGDDTRWTREAALEAGLDPTRVRWYWDRETLAGELTAHLQPGDWVLIKGSRAMGLESIADAVCSGQCNVEKARGH
jgi:UDP-N-acetylmuramyl pentapeptide synthase